ncbi:hypothetical protein NMY22_g301 [Coprinellus aureogranulatus]|nr:hypothetical protein NMY22_g301 [Coprinellus aureogranulatus]
MNSGGGRILRQLSFDHLTFPKLASIRAFLSSDAVLAASQLTSCINLTHLTLVGASFLVDWGYNIGEFLDACPLLNELVAPVQGYTEELYQQLTYDPARPRGRQLQVLVLLCFGLSYQAERDNIRMHVTMRVLGHSTGLIPHSFPISRIVEMVRTRRAAGSDASIDLGHPKQLRRFIYRFLEDPGGRGYELDLIMQLKEELAISLHTFSTDGLELSVEAFKHQPGISLTYCPLAGSHPAGHWDHDTMDFLKAKDGWVFSTSMPPNDSSESMDTS